MKWGLSSRLDDVTQEAYGALKPGYAGKPWA